MDSEPSNFLSNYGYKVSPFSAILRRLAMVSRRSSAILPLVHDSHHNSARSKASEMPTRLSPPICDSFAILPLLDSHRDFACSKASEMSSRLARSKASEMPSGLPPSILPHIPACRFIFLSMKSDQMKAGEFIAICSFAIKDLSHVSSKLVQHVAEGLKCPTDYVRGISKNKLLELYHIYVMECCEDRLERKESFEMIAYSIIKHYLDEKCQKKRFQNLELLFGQELFPSNLEIKFRAHHWIKFIEFFSVSEKKVLEDFLFEKQRFQMLMEDYLEKRKDNSSREELLLMMSNHFPNSSSALSCFRTLDEMKNDEIFRALNYFVRERTISPHGWHILEKSMEHMSDKHEFCTFVNLISLKSSYSIFSDDFVREIFYILYEAHYSSNGDSSGINFDLTLDFLYVCLNVFPHLLKDSEWEFTRLFTINSESFTEKFLCMFSKLGHHHFFSLSDLYIYLKRACLDGTPTQATYAVSIIASLSDASDDLFIYFLWKELVDAIYNGKVSATVMQSVKCILKLFPSKFQGPCKILSRPVRSQREAVGIFCRNVHSGYTARSGYTPRSGYTARRLKLSRRSTPWSKQIHT